jgi:hypothetical protein
VAESAAAGPPLPPVLGLGVTSGLKPICPDMSAAFRVDQLSVYLKAAAGSPQATLDGVIDTKIAADLLRVHGLALIGKSSAAGDNEEFRGPGQIRRQIVGDAIGEKTLALEHRKGRRKARP